LRVNSISKTDLNRLIITILVLVLKEGQSTTCIQLD